MFSRFVTCVDMFVTGAFFATLSVKLLASAEPSSAATANPAASADTKMTRRQPGRRNLWSDPGGLVLCLRSSFMFVASEIGVVLSTDRQGPLHAAVAMTRHAAEERVGAWLQAHSQRPCSALEGRRRADNGAACA